jgi:hypothetical protein
VSGNGSPRTALRSSTRALTDAPRPLTIPEILAQRGDLAQRSVYRNLVVLEDVPASAGLERSVAAAAITRSTGFRTQRHRVDLVGLCRQCA